MANPVTFEIPPSLAAALARDKDETSLPRWALEALVVEAVREGLISRRRGGDILGLSFQGREEFYAGHGVTYDFTEKELEADWAALESMLGKPY